LEQRKALVRSTEMRWRGVVWWRNCCVKMEEKQNGREKLREGQWWKPHVGWPYRIRKYIWSVERKMRNKELHWYYLYTNQSRFCYSNSVAKKKNQHLVCFLFVFYPKVFISCI
jgi:hypothetical protein